jgi:hypothetical protein
VKVGDLVLKNGNLDQGCKGVIIEIHTSSLGTSVLKVLKSNGKIADWYIKLVEVLSESR